MSLNMGVQFQQTKCFKGALLHEFWCFCPQLLYHMYWLGNKRNNPQRLIRNKASYEEKTDSNVCRPRYLFR